MLHAGTKSLQAKHQSSAVTKINVVMKISSLEILILAAAVLCCMVMPSDAECSGVSTTGAANEIIEVCDFEFDLSEGETLIPLKKILHKETYDNSESDSAAPSIFEASIEIEETSKFLYSGISLTITPAAYISTPLPFVSDGIIFLSSSFTDTFGSPTGAVSTRQYSTYSSFQVAPFTKVTKEASYTIALLSVPWTATVRTGVGSIVEISGQWFGLRAYDFITTTTSQK